MTRLPRVTRAALGRLAVFLLLLVAAAGGFTMLRMPGTSYRGPLLPLSDAERDLREELRGHVAVLAGDIGERHLLQPDNLARAVAYLEDALGRAGYEVRRQTYEVSPEASHGLPVERVFHNLEVERRGGSRPAEVVVVGAHYDSIIGSPGANDNATGTAAVLALARRFARRAPARTVRFVAFANEEIYFQQPQMGSLVYARALRARQERVVTMLSLETIGYYSDAAGSQRYPIPFGWVYPSTGNFLAFIGNLGSRGQVRDAIRAFRAHARFPSEGLAIPNVVPGVGWSDHWAFWEAGYPGVMVTDTAPYRYREYHTAADTPDRIDYERLARVVAGLELTIAELAGGAPHAAGG